MSSIIKKKKGLKYCWVLVFLFTLIYGCDGRNGGNGGDKGTNQSTTVNLVAIPNAGMAPLTVNFSATAPDSDGTIYEWDFDGDGIYDQNTGVTSTVSYTYTNIGSYEAKVKVTDKNGATAISSSITIIVSITPTSEQLAFQHLEEVMDKFHKSFDVYTDLSAAGNHFVTLGLMSSTGGENMVEINPGSTDSCFSGVTCIENRFRSSGNNWGGWYFMNGVLEGEETQPRLNWGDYPNTGVDLRGATKLTFMARGKTGGERVEFFAFGVGRDPVTGNPIKPYPDSSPKVSLGYITLNNTWTQYTIDLTGRDMSYVLGGFGWVTNASNNNNADITFYLDDILYDKSHSNDSHFSVSYETISSAVDFDTVIKNIAFTYDNALVLLAFLSRETTEDMNRAKLLADALVYAIHNDRYFSDGRLRNAYQGGDLILFPGWLPHGKANTVRMPGWWDTGAHTWYEDRFTVSTHTGNLAWAMIALLSYYEKKGGTAYIDAAKLLGEWVEKETIDMRGAGGYTGGYEGWEMTDNNPPGQTKILWKSTEHNIDVYVAFIKLYNATGDSIWKDRALYAKAFAEAMWDETEGHFWTGTLEDGVTINTSTVPADVNTWGLMALGNVQKYNKGITWVGNNCYLEADGFKGFDFNNDKDHIWFEGTAHMALAYQITGNTNQSNTFLSELERAQTNAPNNNGKGIVAASYDGLTTGFDWLYFNRLHIGATAWFIFAERGYNPYWGIRTTDPIPIYEGEPASYILTVSKAGTGSGTVTSSLSGINCGSDCSESYAGGTLITLAAVANGGSAFSSWSGCDSTSGNICYVTLNVNKSVAANFTATPSEVTYTYIDFSLTNVCTYDNNWCGYANRTGKAVIYGEMSKDIAVSTSYTKLDVTISIPCNGWGEGLAGPSGSSALIIVDSVTKEEKIDDTMPYHHGGYYKYEYCDSFTNTFDITDKTAMRLIIRMNGGSRLDFQEAKLKFY